MSDVRVIIQRDSEREERVVTTGTTAAELFPGERTVVVFPADDKLWAGWQRVDAANLYADGTYAFSLSTFIAGLSGSLGGQSGDEAVQAHGDAVPDGPHRLHFTAMIFFFLRVFTESWARNCTSRVVSSASFSL